MNVLIVLSAEGTNEMHVLLIGMIPANLGSHFT